MPMLHWKAPSFEQLTGSQLFEVMQLRVNVFVVEQQCAYPELDEHDRDAGARHILGYDTNEDLTAYARVLRPGLIYPDVGIGRLVVKKERRGLGFGHQLLKTALDEIDHLWPGKIVRLAAQEHLQRFYQHHGFRSESDRYLADGIPHVDMVRISC